MYEGYLSLGCVEVLNASRAYHYARTAECPVEWLRMTYCDNLADAVNDGVPYDAADIADAPWYDPRDPATARFYGVYPIAITGFSDSTRTARVTEGILDGGTVSGYRHAARQVRVRAILIARGQDALEAGMSWLDAALAPSTCSMHGDGCGEQDLQFFVSCPPQRDPGETDDSYDARVDAVTRALHGVTVISGPTVEEKLRRDGADGGVWAYIVEFILVAGSPHVFSLPIPIVATPTLPEVVQDIPYNLAPYPSAELSAGTVTVQTNYSTNPSVETDATGWATGADGSSILAANVVGARSTELASVGAASYRATFTTPAASSTPGYFLASQQVLGLPTAAGTRVSVSIWAAGNIQAGTAVLGGLEARVFWQNNSNTVLGNTLIGTLASDSGVMSAKSLLPPAGTTRATVEVRQLVTSRAAGAVIRLYLDALAVTVP